MKYPLLVIAIGLFLGWSATGCSQVEVLRLTSETFPPREVQDVAILSQFPNVQHEKIAELSDTSSSESVSRLQQRLLEKAAELGADAVVFSPSITRTEQRVAYQSMYSPWGYYAPYAYYGPGPYGYGMPWGYRYRYGPWGPMLRYHHAIPVPYQVRSTTVKGTAIRYN